ncbi:MAG: multiheme c-type cytochrome, partial [Desulfomonilaceae bacterium]
MMRSSIASIGVVALAAAIFLGAAEMASRSASCMLCHRQEASYSTWITEKSREEKRGFAHEMIACADCHIQGHPERTAGSRLRSLLHLVTYIIPQMDPREHGTTGIFNHTRVPVQNCQFCHYASVYRKAVYLKDLPEGLKKIGLVMDHRKHVLARENTCSRCHERYKSPDDAVPDKGVNYAEVNHMACDACHSYASHAYRQGRLLPMSEAEYHASRKQAWESLSTNPRWMVAMPSEKTCRRCHNGQIHYKTRIFSAECRTGVNYDNCVKCHPLMTKSYFEEYLKARQKAASIAQPAAMFGGDSSDRRLARQTTASGPAENQEARWPGAALKGRT